MMELKWLGLMNIVKSAELQTICEYTPKLEKLHVEFTDSISGGSMFTWMCSLIPNIRAVFLKEHKAVRENKDLEFLQNRHDLFRGLVNSMKQCGRLESLMLHIGIPFASIHELRTIYLPLRLRGIHCSLGREHYDACFK